jgi:hypothetical protein
MSICEAGSFIYLRKAPLQSTQHSWITKNFVLDSRNCVIKIFFPSSPLLFYFFAIGFPFIRAVTAGAISKILNGMGRWGV